MIDREKIIRLFERCIVNHAPDACKDCPYDDCIGTLLKDVWTVLKTPEPVEPILALDDGEHKLWQCGNCKVAVFTRDTKYCHNCGKVVKWNA